ncbi:hypothetical protein HPB48_026925 [Haemaphysalis longicornis]|uniref:Uncharacterized protein n=1 Tax=Haemaphysalis longicornis TaxID=44386 RepID=A0A9J6H2D3_HAELO|nr:hypothetical protein HPB48_026925 [Haemaphysalis longicornis]
MKSELTNRPPEYNPMALQANRIGKMMSMVIAFNGPKVPTNVKYVNLLVECSLYRKQIDNCFQCGRLGHRTATAQIHRTGSAVAATSRTPTTSQVCTQVQPLRKLTPPGRQDVQGSIQVAVRGAEAAESRQRRDGEGSPPPREEKAASPPPQRHRIRRSLSGEGGSRSESCESRPGSRASSPAVAAKTSRRE